MALRRRDWLRSGGALALAAPALRAAALPTDPLRFPRDLGAHPGQRTEWWYITGHATSQGRPFGFQVTFFRSRVIATQALESRFAAKQLVFAHAALSDLQGRQLLHDQRIARWSGAPPGPDNMGSAFASVDDTNVALDGWTLQRSGGIYRARIAAEDFALALDFSETQPLLLQGDAGLSHKGPDAQQTSRYYSLPQLAVAGTLVLRGQRFVLDAPAAHGNAAWLDHEWSDALLHPDAVGWDWTGMNLFDGSALTLFRLRRRDGSALWAGGSFRARGGAARTFGADAVAFTPGRTWTSPRTGTRYPVEWTVDTPVGRFLLRALLDDQELDSRASTGAVYWEGLSELCDAGGTAVGKGYLEMTGYGDRLRL